MFGPQGILPDDENFPEAPEDDASPEAPDEDSVGAIDPQVIAKLSGLKRRSSSRAYRAFSSIMGPRDEEQSPPKLARGRGALQTQNSSKKARLLQEMKGQIELLSREMKDCEQVIFTHIFVDMDYIIYPRDLPCSGIFSFATSASVYMTILMLLFMLTLGHTHK